MNGPALTIRSRKLLLRKNLKILDTLFDKFPFFFEKFWKKISISSPLIVTKLALLNVRFLLGPSEK